MKRPVLSEVNARVENSEITTAHASAGHHLANQFIRLASASAELPSGGVLRSRSLNYSSR
jgi:hypothetical protein